MGGGCHLPQPHLYINKRESTLLGSLSFMIVSLSHFILSLLISFLSSALSSVSFNLISRTCRTQIEFDNTEWVEFDLLMAFFFIKIFKDLPKPKLYREST